MSNLRKHGLDFADLDLAFFASALVLATREDRLQGIGWMDGVLVVSVVFKPMGREAVSVISLRPASERERHLYEQSV